jgi:lipoyl(octanoyl) transferase
LHLPITVHRSPFTVRRLGLADYEAVWGQMKEFTLARTASTPDELWQVEHPPVYTLGLNARPENLPRIDNGIPVVKTDRGGQITYHGPGQVVVYALLDLRRRGLGVRPLVRKLERAVIELLRSYRVEAVGREDAPGVYVNGAKIAALGLRIRNGCSYHGISLNVDLHLAPFEAIDPCGHAGMKVTRTRDLGIDASPQRIADALLEKLAEQL